MSNANGHPAVVIEGLRVIRGKRVVLPDLSLHVPAGQVVGLLGPSGSGKTTLMRAIVGDEPTVGLDPVLRRDLWNHFRSLAADGYSLIVSSHVMDEAARCDRLILLREGRVLADVTPAELLEQTGQTDADAAFLALVDASGGEEIW